MIEYTVVRFPTEQLPFYMAIYYVMIKLLDLNLC